MATQREVFKILIKDSKDREMIEPLLFHAVRVINRERLAWLLDKVPDTIISFRVFAAIAEDWDDGKMATLLSRYPGLAITEQMLEIAVESASLEHFRLILAIVANPKITEKMCRFANHQIFTIKQQHNASYPEKMSILLERMGESDFTPDLIRTAVHWCEKDFLEAMLKRGGASKITEDVMIAAAPNHNGKFQLALEYGGKVTDTLLDRMASIGEAQAWQFLLEQEYEISVSVDRIKRAAFNNDSVLSKLLDHADEIPANDMTGLIFEVAREGRKEPVRQLLDHAKYVEVSQDMVMAAILNPHDRLGRVEEILKRSRGVQITEDMLVITAGDSEHAIKLFQMLLARKGRPKISEYVLIAAACNRY